MAPATITTAVFDIGNVLYRWDPRFLYERLIDDAAALDAFLATVVTHEWHFQHDAGRPLAPMVAELKAAHPQHAALIDAYVPRWLETIPGPVPGSIELVERLADADVPIYGITNFGTEFWDMFRPTAPIFDRFRDIIVSGEHGMIKPDPAIFRLALDRFGLAGPEALFIDDRPDNVRAAESCGFAGHHFRDAATLEAELDRHGLLHTSDAP